MDVRLRLFGRRHIDDLANLLNVQSAGGKVSGDKNCCAPGCKFLHGAITIWLGEAAVQDCRLQAPFAQLLCERPGLVPAGDEDDSVTVRVAT
ncbi:hypothetical protein AA23498_0273 [Acetobacter nitrogenifigens DSM 23921 = NBRC 105050]|nr:hypothetical protein AA23498_0273 [Acetobacter nitrogenifigens DSM 23921 = NBRC 105050]